MLIIDYGRDGTAGDSLQAVAEHRPVDIFHQPGTADLSHWVDFAALSRSAATHGCRLIGPVPQGRFLMRIGLAQRAEQAALHWEGKPAARPAGSGRPANQPDADGRIVQGSTSSAAGSACHQASRLTESGTTQMPERMAAHEAG